MDAIYKGEKAKGIRNIHLFREWSMVCTPSCQTTNYIIYMDGAWTQTDQRSVQLFTITVNIARTTPMYIDIYSYNDLYTRVMSQ